MTCLFFPHVPSVDPLWNLLKTDGIRKRVHRQWLFCTGFAQVFSQAKNQLYYLFFKSLATWFHFSTGTTTTTRYNIDCK